MELSSDYRELLNVLKKYKVRYLVVGAYAVIYYTEPRYTKDIDIWVKPDIKNAVKLYNALKEFGAPLRGIRVEDFTNPNLIYQIGVEPVRVDIIMSLPGVSFDTAWKRRKKVMYGDIQINLLSIEDLIKVKKKLRRPNDILDIEKLKKVSKLKLKK
ncbi:MAG: nucleotidyltransferase [Endomicrobia bacterium]|nr:nucleotidyltransferase [Endomicrobiia bacterium]